MIAIAVDDEILMLGALVKAISASPDISQIEKFSDCDVALEFIKENHADIAFLDINMRGMGGLALAEKIIAEYPKKLLGVHLDVDDGKITIKTL